MSPTPTGGYNLGQLTRDRRHRACPDGAESAKPDGAWVVYRVALNRLWKRGEMLRVAVRAALFDGTVFDEIGEEPEDMFRALGVVLVAAIAFGLGVRSVLDTGAGSDNGVEINLTMFIAISSIVTSWAIWSAMVWLLGTKLFQGKASYRGLLRALGICYGPVVFWLFLNVPIGGPLLSMFAHIWILMAGVVAVQRAQDFAWWKAVISASIGWLWALVLLPIFLVVPPA